MLGDQVEEGGDWESSEDLGSGRDGGWVPDGVDESAKGAMNETILSRP